MSRNKLRSLNDLGKLVYSTGNKSDALELNENEDSENLLVPTSEQMLEAHYSRKGRNGKVVTVISGFKGSANDLQVLAKMLKTRCGVGGSVKKGEIIIQGNCRDKVMRILKDEGYRVKRVGG